MNKIAVCVLLVIPIVLVASGCKTCVRSHKELVEHPGFAQIVPIGKTMTTIVHPRFISLDDVCDEYQE